MKKKNNEFNPDRIFIIIIPLVLITFIAVGIFYDALRYNQPKFTITKEECRNESKWVGIKLINREDISCNQTITIFNTCGGERKECYEKSPYKEEYSCDTDYCHFWDISEGYSSCYDYDLEIRRENYSYMKDNYEDIIKTEEVCFEKEVEEDILINSLKAREGKDVYEGYHLRLFNSFLNKNCNSWVIKYGFDKEIIVNDTQDLEKACGEIKYYFEGSCVVYDKEISGTWSGWYECSNLEELKVEYSLLYKYINGDLTTEWLDEECVIEKNIWKCGEYEVKIN